MANLKFRVLKLAKFALDHKIFVHLDLIIQLRHLIYRFRGDIILLIYFTSLRLKLPIFWPFIFLALKLFNLINLLLNHLLELA